MLAIIRIRGNAGKREEIKKELRMLNLAKKNSCCIIDETPNYMGMLRKVKDFVTWGEIEKDVLKKLVEKRGRTKKNEKLTKEVLKRENTKIDELVKKILEGKVKETCLKPYFNLNSPSRGFKGSVKQHYPRGAIGNRKEKINDLLKRMM